MLPNRAFQTDSLYATARSVASVSISTSKPISTRFQAPKLLNHNAHFMARAFPVPSLQSTTRSFASISTVRPVPTRFQKPKLLPDARLMARAFHRVLPKVANSSASSAMTVRRLSGSPMNRKWEGGQPEENPTREKDTNNVQHDAVKEGKEERAKGQGSRGTSEESGGSNKKAKEEFPEAPDTIGMQDERGRNTKK